MEINGDWMPQPFAMHNYEPSHLLTTTVSLAISCGELETSSSAFRTAEADQLRLDWISAVIEQSSRSQSVNDVRLPPPTTRGFVGVRRAAHLIQRDAKRQRRRMAASQRGAAKSVGSEVLQ
jgi:hypothetical protein